MGVENVLIAFPIVERIQTIVKMFLLTLLIHCSLAEGDMVDLDVGVEKLLLQMQGAFNYMLGSEEVRDISQDVTFNLYTRKNPQVPQILPVEYPFLLHLSYFNPKLKSYLLIHGYTDHKNREIIARLRLVLTNAEDSNVIVVDWGRLAAFVYVRAVENTIPVGLYVGRILAILERNFIDLGNVHLIGHSLGAHISGIAGAHVGGRLGRITGLDPAGPLFELIEVRNDSISLDKSDALFVDVIHTDADEFGLTKPIGHADFYPNEGTSPQPGCNSLVTSVSCSHIRSVDFYTESVLNEYPFEARHCNVSGNDDCLNEKPVEMGHYCSLKARGVYFLETNAEPPFAKRY